jgi:hypothetical protein
MYGYSSAFQGPPPGMARGAPIGHYGGYPPRPNTQPQPNFPQPYAQPVAYPQAPHGRGAQIPPGRAIGARGAPTGPRSDLSKADTGLSEHQLYVKIVNGEDPDTKSKPITLRTLQYICGIKDELEKMGIAVRVNKIKSTSLVNQDVVTAMKKRGITRLPALTTVNNVYLGEKEIHDLYERNLQEFQAIGRRGERAAALDTPDDELQAWFQDEMTLARADEDADETGIGENENMMEAYQDMVRRREQNRPARPQPNNPHARRDAQEGGEFPEDAPRQRSNAPAQRQQPALRQDNVRGGGNTGRRRDAPIDPEDAEIEETISRLSRDLDGSTRQKAFSAGGGDSFADEDGDPHDDLMEAAYWSNNEVS